VKPLNPQSFAAFVGNDWADTKHDVCMLAAGSDQRGFGCIAHQVARIDVWANSLHPIWGRADARMAGGGPNRSRFLTFHYWREDLMTTSL
jgi:hypothetical protein